MIVLCVYPPLGVAAAMDWAELSRSVFPELISIILDYISPEIKKYICGCDKYLENKFVSCLSKGVENVNNMEILIEDLALHEFDLFARILIHKEYLWPYRHFFHYTMLRTPASTVEDIQILVESRIRIIDIFRSELLDPDLPTTARDKFSREVAEICNMFANWFKWMESPFGFVGDNNPDPREILLNKKIYYIIQSSFLFDHKLDELVESGAEWARHLNKYVHEVMISERISFMYKNRRVMSFFL